MKKVIIFLICCLVFPDVFSEDPFIDERVDEQRISSPILYPVTFGNASKAFGIQEWTLKDWPDPVEKEIRIYFRPSNKSKTELIRVAVVVGGEYCWIEKRDTSFSNGPTWGSVENRVSVKIKSTKELSKYISLAGDNKLYAPLSQVDKVIINGFMGGGSVTILDIQKKEERKSILVRNADLVETVKDEFGLSRDFSDYGVIFQGFRKFIDKAEKQK